MTPTSDERREVAARLRALPSDIYSTIKGWEKDGLFIDATLCDEAYYSQIHSAVFGCFPAEYVYPGDRDEFHNRLADLIDPTCEIVPFDEESMRLPHCSSCGQPILKPWPNFCPHCGARVTGGGDS